MGIFSKWVKSDDEVFDIDLGKTTAKPYFYLTMNTYGGAGQEVERLADRLPDLPAETQDSVRENGGLVSVASGIDKPEVDDYLDGVMCTVWANTRIEAAGAIMAFTTMSDEMLSTHLMHNVALAVAELPVDDNGDHDDEAANEIYEFTKSEDNLVIGIPTADDSGEFDFSGCYLTIDSPRRTDSEASRIVIQGSNVLYATSALPAMMSSLHQDIGGVYGYTLPGSGPAEDIDGDDDTDWYS